MRHERPSIAEFCSHSFPLFYEGKRVVTVLRAYCDESIVSERTRVAAVGGVLSAIEGWEHFEPRWLDVLKRHGVECFHMTDFENREREFKDWPENKRIDFITSLIDVISLTSPRLMVAACAMVLDDYDALPEPARAMVSDPLDFLSEWLIRQFGYFLTMNNINGRVAYVFEERRGVGRVIESFHRAKQKIGGERRLESMAQGAKREFVPLQAADFVAYEAAKAALRDTGGSDLPQRKSLLRLIEGTVVRGYLYDTKTLLRCLDAGIVRPLSDSDRDLFGRDNK